MSEKSPPGRHMNIVRRTARMEAFSDGVYAIAITLLVLDLAVPRSSETSVPHALLHEWPIFMAYIVSFASIGASWLGHSAITEYLDRADSILLRLNLLVLFFVSLLPFPTHMLANFLHNDDAERLAVTIYGINLLAMTASTALMWRYAVAEGLVSQDKEDDDVKALTAKLNPGLLFYVITICIGLVFPRVAVGIYLVIALFIVIPFRAIGLWIRHMRRRG